MRRLPAGRAITKVLKVPESWADGEKLWMDGLFDANMLFPDRASSRTARCAVTYNVCLELTGWTLRTYLSWTTKKRFEKSFRRCSNPKATAARWRTTAALRKNTSNATLPTRFG